MKAGDDRAAAVQDRERLQRLREEIEAVDLELLALLKRRMEIVERVVETKLAAASPFRDPEREELVLRRVRHLAVEQDLDAHAVERLYRSILQMSVSRQQAHVRSLPGTPLRVAYQGVEGSYSHLAAQRRYAGLPSGALLTGFPRVHDVCEAVRDGGADAALLPIENTTAGSINATYDGLADGGLAVVGEQISRIEHHLLGLPGATVEGLRAVYSHPQALSQCERFLRRLPNAEPREEFDTAGAALRVKQEGDPSLAAIASEAAAGRYGLEILARGIESQEGNFTRFVEIARESVPCPPDAACKTSLMLKLGHEPGTLGKVLNELGRRGINLTKLESRPILGEPWSYRFYLDLEGHVESEPVEAALAAVGELAGELTVLGSYARG